MFFEGIALAQQAANAQGGTQEVLFTTVIPLALLFGIFYFLIIRPQTKKAAEHARMVSSLKRNDEVVTTGGLIGRVTEIGDRVLVVEIAPNVRVRVERSQIAALSSYGKTPASKKDKGEQA
jgi:preprotein translocase subunit YajC